MTLFILPDKKETQQSDFPVKFENANYHKILISDQIILNLECGVDEYQCLSCAGTIHMTLIGKRVFEAFIFWRRLRGISSMLYN